MKNTNTTAAAVIILCTATTVTVATTAVRAQVSQTSQQLQPSQPSRHELSLVIGDGISTLNYTPAAGKANLGFGGFAGLGYTFLFSEHWGIGTGVEAALFNGKCSLDPLSDHYPSNDGIRDFEYHYTLTSYRDRQQAILLNIPLMLHFRFGGKYDAALGGKVGIPLSATFSTGADKLDASGLYPPPILTLHEPTFMGFGEFNGLGHRGDLSLKTAFFASAELGRKWLLSDKLSLSTGLYVDYGLNNVRPPSTAPLIDYHGNDDYRPNSVLTSTTVGKPLVGKLNPIAAGIKLGLIFGIPSHKAAEVTLEPEPDTFEVEDWLWRKEMEEQRFADEARHKAEKQRRRAKEIRRAEEKRAEEERLAEERKTEETRRAEQKHAEEERTEEKLIDGYRSDSTTLSAQQKAILDERAVVLLQLPLDVQIILEGHACDFGTHDVNVSVGQRRADVVKNYLVKKGIAANRMTTVSKAETVPLVPNTNEANRKKNRRVVVRNVGAGFARPM
ncbi:hypothetical protein FACS1894199_10810 [Bacteroidia bacterium]|nr:hypothetical protein FACS1894199_10810 [Bacteroidia bacterium]